MSDLLTSIRSVVLQDGKVEEELLRTVRTSQRKQPEQKAKTVASTSAAERPSIGEVVPLDLTTLKSPQDALVVLRSQPDTDTLNGLLEHVLHPAAFGTDFWFAATSPINAQITNVLVNTIVPDLWSELSGEQRRPLEKCLTTVSGINAILARLKLLAGKAKSTKVEGAVESIRLYLDVIHQILSGDGVASSLWTELDSITDWVPRTDLIWREAVNILASGKVISTVAQAEDAIESSSTKFSSRRLSDGHWYATWLGGNIACMLLENYLHKNVQKPLTQLLSKSLSLGYPLPVIKALDVRLVRFVANTEPNAALNVMRSIMIDLPTHSRQQFLEHSLRWLSGLCPDSDVYKTAEDQQIPSDVIKGAMAFLSCLLADMEILQKVLIEFLTDPILSSTLAPDIRRASTAFLFEAAADLAEGLLEKSMSTFGDKLFIRHSPILQQEAVAHVLLLSAGYVHRKTPMALLMAARSSPHMQGVSNRLNANSQRARWLGMVVGTAVSSLVDKEGSRMNFGTDDMQSEEAQWWLNLVKIEDAVGDKSDLRYLLDSSDQKITKSKPQQSSSKAKWSPKINGKQVFGPPLPPEMAAQKTEAKKPVQTEVQGAKITELLDENPEDGSDDDLKPYAKPDSDPEDSDEDATLVNRNKFKTPVYIRDLMAGLQDDKSHDRFETCLKCAASLIRRKSKFGAEVSDRAIEIASILMNLGNPFDTEDFDELRLQALIAVFTSDVKKMSTWFCRQAFEGDYSLGQRCVILSAIGLGGRELAGLANEDELNPVLNHSSFPSKRLPDRLHAVYSPANPSTRRIEQATKRLEHQLIQPMALRAADQSTAHLNALKVRTFSSRMEVERTKRKPAPNLLAKVLGEAILFPLLARFQQDMSAYGSRSAYAASFLLTTYLKTLALLLHASGPATMDIVQVTTEFWDLLLSLRVRAAGDISVLEALLFSLLTVLEVNSDKRAMAHEHTKRLLESQEWVEIIFERTGGGNLVGPGNEEEAKIRTLAAGILMRTSEVAQEYQNGLMGRMASA